jgi:mitochondrial fission protein ELM1
VSADGVRAAVAAVPVPRVWVLLGDKTGDNEQCLVLAEALGWPHETRRLAYNARFRRWNVRLGARLASLDRARSDALVAPWPDLVVAAGRRSVPVARWIRARSGGRTRLVQLGRPRAPLVWFDLIVTTPQYGLPAAANVVVVALPLARRRVADAATVAAWSARLATLPRPHIAVLVGGRGDPLTVDAAAATRLGEDTSALALRLGGSLLIATSRRTGSEALAALGASIRAPHVLHRWGTVDVPDPYAVFLADADRFVVTGDSASLLADAVGSGRPVALSPASRRPTLGHRAREALAALGPLSRWALDVGLVAGPRRLEALHAALLASGRATLLGRDEGTARLAPGRDELAAVVTRVRRLVEGTAP